MDKFEYVWAINPIDFWENCLVPSLGEAQRVLSQMPESSRDEVVYKLFLPNPPGIVPVYFCKADNDGTVYMFSDFDVFKNMGFIRRFDDVK